MFKTGCLLQTDRKMNPHQCRHVSPLETNCCHSHQPSIHPRGSFPFGGCVGIQSFQQNHCYSSCCASSRCHPFAPPTGCHIEQRLNAPPNLRPNLPQDLHGSDGILCAVENVIKPATERSSRTVEKTIVLPTDDLTNLVKTTVSASKTIVDNAEGTVPRFGSTEDFVWSDLDELAENDNWQRNGSVQLGEAETTAGHLEPQKEEVATAASRLRNADPNFRALRHYLFNKKHLPELSHSAKVLVARQSANYCVLNNDLLYKNPKTGKSSIYIEDVLRRQAIMKATHDRYGHPRREEMMDKIADDNLYWTTIREDVTKYVAECQQCQTRGLGLIKVRDKLRQIKIVSKAWYLVGLDLITDLQETVRGNHIIMTLVDYYTKWVEAIPLPARDAVTVANALFERVFCRFGCPHRILTDNGREFSNQVNAQMNKLMGVTHSTTRPYTPRSNGMVERLNRTLQEKLNAKVKSEGGDWDLHLNRSLMELRVRKLRSTGFSPFDLFYAFPFRLDPSKSETADEDELIAMMEGNDESLEAKFDDECFAMMEKYDGVRELLRAEAEKNIKKEKDRQKKSFDVRQLGLKEELLKGEIVYFFDRDPRNKIKSKAKKGIKGPAEVVEITSDGAVLRYGRTKHRVRNVDIRKPKAPPTHDFISHETEDEDDDRRSRRFNVDQLKSSYFDQLKSSYFDGLTPEEIILMKADLKMMFDAAAEDEFDEESEVYRIRESLAEKRVRPTTKRVRSSQKRTKTETETAEINCTPEIKRSKMTCISANENERQHQLIHASVLEGPKTRSRVAKETSSCRPISPPAFRNGLIGSDIPFVRSCEVNLFELGDTDAINTADTDSVEIDSTSAVERVKECQKFMQFYECYFDRAYLDPIDKAIVGKLTETNGRSLPDCRALLTKSQLRSDLAFVNRQNSTLAYKKFDSLPQNYLELMDASAWLEISRILKLPIKRDKVCQNVVWVKLSRGIVSLSVREQLLAAGQWIDDEAIAACAEILMLQYPHQVPIESSLNFHFDTVKKNQENTCRMLRRRMVRMHKRAPLTQRRHQPLFVNGNHWIVVSNIEMGRVLPISVVQVFDSLPPSPSAVLKHQVAAVFRSEFDHLTVHWPIVEEQPNTCDCAVYCMAFLSSISRGIDPSTLDLDVSVIRRDAIRFFEQKRFDAFSAKSTRNIQPICKRMTIRILCFCRMPLFSPKEETIRCAQKNCRWKVFHYSCVAELERNSHFQVPDKWICPNCVQLENSKD